MSQESKDDWLTELILSLSKDKFSQNSSCGLFWF